MRFRKLRIAWSVAWAIAAVLLIALWARSYWRLDSLWRDDSVHTTIIESNSGDLCLNRIPMPTQPTKTQWVSGRAEKSTSIPFQLRRRINWLSATNRLLVSAPHSIFVAVLSAISVMPWFLGRYTVRTLLIVTTLVAVVLGLVVWASH